MPLDLKKAFPGFAAKQQVGFGGDRSETVGASEIGQCARKIAYEKHYGKKKYDANYAPPNGASIRGNIMEDHYSVPLLEHTLSEQAPDAKLIWASQADQQRFVSEAWKLSATPDGLIINAPRDFLKEYGVEDTLCEEIAVELKSYDPRTNTNNHPKSAHVEQINSQMGLINAAGEYAPKWGIIVYVDASFMDEISVYPVRFDPAAFDNQKSRAIAVMTVEHPDMIRPEGKIAGGHECNYCPFQGSCKGYADVIPTNTVAFEDMASGSKQLMMSAVGTYANVQRQIDDLTPRLEVAKAEIKELLASNGSRFVKGKMRDKRTFEIAWKKRKGSRRANAKAAIAKLEELGIDTDEYYTEGKPTEYLTIDMKLPTDDRAYDKYKTKKQKT